MELVVIAGAVFLLFGIVVTSRKSTEQINELKLQLNAARKEIQALKNGEGTGEGETS